jgi:hypothetical protein
LDELRRAKATTVVKLEKEYVSTSIPGLVLILKFKNNPYSFNLLV